MADTQAADDANADAAASFDGLAGELTEWMFAAASKLLPEEGDG